MTVRRALVAGLALAAGVAGAADTCSTPAETLVTECGGVCDDYMPCSVYNASSSCSGCEEDDDEVCSYFCFTPYQDSDTTFLFFVPFGSYVSDEETAARAVDSNYDNELSALSSDYKSYAYSGNDIMVAMGALDLASTVTTLYVALRRLNCPTLELMLCLQQAHRRWKQHGLAQEQGGVSELRHGVPHGHEQHLGRRAAQFQPARRAGRAV